MWGGGICGGTLAGRRGARAGQGPSLGEITIRSVMECAALPRPDLSNLGTKHCTRVAFGGGGQ